ncbi:sulfatase [Verrucomicrobia bacterium LW23]|nr:sulfatase [Verrucomicrobia bacterium LW23]
MNVVMVMFDSLNRRMLQPYGCTWTHTPHFQRLARRATTFENSYVCSMPCMPARRDLHTGRPNFLHRSWSPLEPFDDSMPQMLKKAGIHTHFSTDHYHYFEDGGATYHTRYSTWDFSRGQEGDPWIGRVDKPVPPPTEFKDENYYNEMRMQDQVNRAVTESPELFPMYQTFRNGIDFIRSNRNAQGQWFVQIETFDPHEPFTSLPEHKKLYAEHYDTYKGDAADWPVYRPVRESKEAVEHCRYEYASLLSACDSRMGQILDLFDELDMWKDTMLIVWTDHGFLLGEQGKWAKCWTHFYQEIAHTPFFVWDPRCPAAAGTRRRALVQPSIDLAPTVLGFFGLAPTPDMTGHDLAAVIAEDTPVRDYALFGMFGAQINITDGRYVYMRGNATPDNQPLFEYGLMPTHMRNRFTPAELAHDTTALAQPFSFTKGCPLLRMAGSGWGRNLPTLLYDVQADPEQSAPIQDAELEARFTALIAEELIRLDAPREQFARMGIEVPVAAAAV